MKGTTMNFDLSSLALKDTTNLQLRHPVSDELLWADKDEEKPVAISLYGTSSKQYRNAINAMQNRALKRGKKQPKAEEIREEGIELLVACSDKAVNLTHNGKAVETPESFRALYSDPAYSWLKEQVDAGLGDTSNFLGQ